MAMVLLSGCSLYFGADGRGNDPGGDDDTVVRSQLVAGGHFTCLRRETAISCWGANNLGQLGMIQQPYAQAPGLTPQPTAASDRRRAEVRVTL
jgi:hypothetical protein